VNKYLLCYMSLMCNSMCVVYVCLCVFCICVCACWCFNCVCVIACVRACVCGVFGVSVCVGVVVVFWNVIYKCEHGHTQKYTFRCS
jgi:hypothetical protein